jgi:N-acyl-D-aspartate/D-glutamate deacylase
VVFDPRSIGSRATYENPYQQADGISYVIVNGRVSYAYRESIVGVPTGLILKS